MPRAVVNASPTRVSDLRGAARLTVAGVAGIVDLVEAMHHNAAIIPRLVARPAQDRTTGVTRHVYRSIHGAVELVGWGLDGLLKRLAPMLGERSPWPGREALVAALNGVLGDYLEATGNPLAIAMSLRRDGIALPQGRERLAAAIPRASGKVVVLLHGLCMNDLQWTRRGHDHGAALARDLECTPVYLHYNSGLHVSINGRELAGVLESLLQSWPVPLTELVLIGHSMGGLVARSAFHYGAQARHEWPRRVGKLVFLGTPHHGAPLERGGNWIDVLLGANRYSAPLARIGKVRSTGITDLRFGNLLDEDWDDRDRFAHGGDRRVPVPLPAGVACFAIGANAANKATVRAGILPGDGLVPLASALGRHATSRRTLSFQPSRQKVLYATSHLDLLGRKAVYAQIRRWLTASP